MLSRIVRLEEAADFTTCEADILQSSYSQPIEETIYFDEEATKTPQNPATPLDWWWIKKRRETGFHRLSLTQAFRHLEPKPNPNPENISKQLTLQKVT